MNWIKVRNDLATHPHTVRIASALRAHVVHISGALVQLWSQADVHASGEFLPGMTLDAVDYMVGLPGFAAELAKVGWIRETEKGIELVDYEKHNGPNAKRRFSEMIRKQEDRRNPLKDCLDSVRSDADKLRTKRGQKPDKQRTLSGPLELELELEKKEKDSCSEPVESTSSKQLEPTLFEFPCRGKVKTFAVCQSHLDQLASFYPGLDVLVLTRRALAWAVANPAKRKTAVGMPKFLDNWMSRAVDREGGKQSQGQTITPRFDSRPDLAKEAPKRPAFGKQDPKRDPADGLWYAKDANGVEVGHDGETWLTSPEWRGIHPTGWKPEYAKAWLATRGKSIAEEGARALGVELSETESPLTRPVTLVAKRMPVNFPVPKEIDDPQMLRGGMMRHAE